LERLHRAALVAILGASASTSAQADIFTFDTVSRMNQRVAGGASHLTGILRNTTTPLTVEFGGVPPQCLPLILIMMEKPGRYYLTLNFGASTPLATLSECAIELRD
jgi:hypothetical protein